MVTYHTEIQTGHVPGMRSHLWGAGVPSHCKWAAEDRDDLEPRKGGKLAATEGNFHIPDTTLAQLSVKELNKRVSQVSYCIPPLLESNDVLPPQVLYL